MIEFTEDELTELHVQLGHSIQKHTAEKVRYERLYATLRDTDLLRAVNTRRDAIDMARHLQDKAEAILQERVTSNGDRTSQQEQPALSTGGNGE